MLTEYCMPTRRESKAQAPTGRLLVGALVCLIAGAAGCRTTQSPTDRIEASAIETSHRELPRWIVDGDPGEKCPPRHTCVIGRIEAAPARGKAVDAAKTNGYRLLAEKAYPVEIASKMQVRTDYSSTEQNETAVDEQIRARVSGRLREADVLETVWVRRREYRVDGAREVYDAWALTAMQSSKLNSLYEREKQRSAKMVDELRRRIGEVQKKLDGQPAVEDWRRGLQVFRRASDELPNLQPVDGREQLASETRLLGETLTGRLETKIEVVGWRAADRKARVRVAARMQGEPIAGLEYRAGSPCFESSRTLEATDTSGHVEADIEFGSYLEPCELTVHPAGLEGASRGERIGPVATCVHVDIRGAVQGYAAGFFRERLGGRVRRIVGRHLDGRQELCREGGNRRRPLELQAAMDLEFGEPSRVSGRDVWRSGGPAEVQLMATMGGTTRELVAESTTLNGFGQDHNQLRRGLLQSATKLIDKTFASPLGNL
jgi:hypothetical protein